MSATKVLIYLIRRDLRVSDNPILHHLASAPDHGFTHILPVFVLPPHQCEVSGFTAPGTESPYPEARSEVGRFWRCGPHRIKFIAQSVWNMKENLGTLGIDLIIRIGQLDTVATAIVQGLRQKQYDVGAVWMIEEEGYEEKRAEKDISAACKSLGADFKAWVDEKYFIDDRDLQIDTPQDLPDVFTTYRKMMEPLREKPRASLPKPAAGTLPKPVEASSIPHQEQPFVIPDSYDTFEDNLLRPLRSALPEVPAVAEDIASKSAHPFSGGEDPARDRLNNHIKSGHAITYKSSRNGLLGPDFSTKLSAFLAQGCITARQVHEALVSYEDGKETLFADVEGYGEGENEGTKAIRFELLWRDYMRLCTKKFKGKLFRRSGFRDDNSNKWKSAVPEMAEANRQQQSTEEVANIIKRITEGMTGMGLIDASQRELLHTGYTSNRARQNVASFLAKHLEIDWRYGAEWYEMLLVDYDVSSNWANWQYVSGVGNDPRGEARIFNPVKQAFDYDKEGEYVRLWVPEVRQLEKLEHVFQAWTTPKDDWDRLGLVGLEMAENPVKKIEFSVEGKPKNSRRPFARRRGQGRSGHGSQSTSSHHQQTNGDRQPPDAQQGNPQRSGEPGSHRGGFRGGRGYNGGYRGRGFGGYRGGYRGGRGQGQWQPGYYVQGPRPIQQWPSTGPPTQ
ncbi:DASH family cryptochrome [Xylariomycetidae sp. FL2044]|nr:DASH family cryptochrome [Xylariomycetidae sp. FL2044]